MEYLFILLATFIGMLFLMQLVFFEITRSKMAKAENVNWYLSLDKSFSYNRVGYSILVYLLYFISCDGSCSRCNCSISDSCL